MEMQYTVIMYKKFLRLQGGEYCALTKTIRMICFSICFVLCRSSLAQMDQSSDMFFIAGMPIQQCVNDEIGEEFISQILRLKNSYEFESILTLSDSSEVLYKLNYYPSESKIVSLSCSYDNELKSDFKLLVVNTNDFSSNSKSINYYDTSYKLYPTSLRPIYINDEFVMTAEFHNYDAQAFSKQVAFGIEKNKEIDFGSINQAIINGGNAGPFFAANNDKVILYGHPHSKNLIIPSYLDTDSIFYTIIPQQTDLIPNRYSAYLILKTDNIELLYYRKGENGKGFYHLHNKETNASYSYAYDDSNLNLKQYGEWIVGPSRLQISKYNYEGDQPGSEYWIKEPNKYGLSVQNYYDRYIKRIALSGYLAIRNIYDPSIFIEWDTEQGDSEVLAVRGGTVYYRKHDEIWFAKIVHGNTLGKSVRLVKSDIVTCIHFISFRD